MVIIHARSYIQALECARREGLGPSKWSYATGENIRGLRGVEMWMIKGCEHHEDHGEIMDQAALQEFKVIVKR